MRLGRASFTSSLVAFGRAVGTHDAVLGRVCHDPVAQKLLPTNMHRAVDAAQHLPVGLFSVLRRASFGLFDHIALRTAHIDAAVEDALRAGATQLVILGAGLDARALRMPSLGHCNIFEVDHPDTQALKRKRVASLAPLAKQLHYVAWDFHRIGLEQALVQAGFDASARSLWLWEGVTMYLEEPAVRTTLALASRLCAPESTFISTYLRPQLAVEGPLWGRIGSFGLARLSEPVRFTCTKDDYASLLAAHGFEVRSDGNSEQIARTLGIPLLRARFGMPEEAVAVALKRPLQ